MSPTFIRLLPCAICRYGTGAYTAKQQTEFYETCIVIHPLGWGNIGDKSDICTGKQNRVAGGRTERRTEEQTSPKTKHKFHLKSFLTILSNCQFPYLWYQVLNAGTLVRSGSRGLCGFYWYKGEVLLVAQAESPYYLKEGNTQVFCLWRRK